MREDVVLRLACQTKEWRDALKMQTNNAVQDPGFASQYVEQAMIAAARVVAKAYR